MRILGIISASILKGFVVFSDNFNRSTTGSLGTSSSGGLWNAVRGVWSANGTQATSSGAASDYPLATVPMLSPNNVLKVATSNGVGLAFWVSGAGDWWAAVPVSTSASENFSTCTFNSCCSTTAKSCCYAFGVNTSPSVCNSFVDLDYGPIYLDSGYVTCDGTFNCLLTSISRCQANAACCGTQCVSSNCCTGSPTNTRTRFYWALRVIKAIGGVFTTESEVAIANSLTNSNLINSISAVTAGDSLVATAFSDTNSLTQTGTPITIPLTNSVKANGVGIIKTPSTNNQGSTADNFTVN
jgi:hypothetical protein